jgi:hypothetical protein
MWRERQPAINDKDQRLIPAFSLNGVRFVSDARERSTSDNSTAEHAKAKHVAINGA